MLPSISISSAACLYPPSSHTSAAVLPVKMVQALCLLLTSARRHSSLFRRWSASTCGSWCTTTCASCRTLAAPCSFSKNAHLQEGVVVVVVVQEGAGGAGGLAAFEEGRWPAGLLGQQQAAGAGAPAEVAARRSGGGRGPPAQRTWRWRAPAATRWRPSRR
jgi:hypothetical protein